MKRSYISGLIIAAFLLLRTTTASAVPTISIDLDPGTAGIQAARIVDPGDVFTIDVVIADDGLPVTPTVFDTVILEAFFNDAGAVLGLGPTGPIWGALAGSPTDFNLFGVFAPSVVGAAAGFDGSFPGVPFTSGSGALGLIQLGGLFGIGPGPPISIFSIDFTALSAGTSTILAAGTPAPGALPGAPELAFFGAPIFAGLASGSVTVTPEPGSWLLLGTGLLGLAGWRRWKKST